MRKGTPISVFFAQPAPPAKVKGKQEKKAAQQAASGGPVPALHAGVPAAVLAHQVAERGIVPKTVGAYSTAKRGTVFATKPPAGTKLQAGDTLTLFVSAGSPELAFDDGEDIQLADGVSDKPLGPVASGPQLEKDPTFAPVGKRVAYAADGQLYVVDLAKPDAAPRRLTTGTVVYTDPAWAPTPDRDVLALARKTSDTESSLCLGALTPQRLVVRCKQQPGQLVGRAIHWSRDGRTILAFTQDALGRQGIMRWRSTQPFSPTRATGPQASSSPPSRPRAGARSTPRSRPTARRSPWRRTSDRTASASI